MKVFSTYFIDPIKNHYIDFAGKATRTQYWLWVLFLFIVSLVLGLVFTWFGTVGTIILRLFGLAILLPSLAISARRLRDAGFWPWLAFFSILGTVATFVNSGILSLAALLVGIVLFILHLFPSKN